MGDIDDLIAISPTQAAMVADSLRVPGAYVAQVECEVAGDLDIETVQRAWRSATAEFPLLRSSFLWDDVERPLQVVWADAAVPITVLPDVDAGPGWDDVVANQRHIGFELEVPELSRVVVARVGPDRTRMLWTHHHAVADGWTVAAVLEHVLAECDQPGRSPMAPPPVTWSDLEAQVAPEDSVAAWHELAAPVREGGGPDVVHYDRIPGRSGRSIRTHLARRVGAALRDGAAAGGVSPAAVAVAAVGLVRSRVTGSHLTTVGVTLSGREVLSPELAGAVGCTIATVPVSVAIAPEATGRDHLRSVHAALRAAARHQVTPAPRIAEAHGLAHIGPLLDWIVVYENYPRPATTGARLRVVSARSISTTAGPVCLVLRPDGDDVELTLEHDAAVLDDEAADALLAHVADTVLALARTPEVQARWIGCDPPARMADPDEPTRPMTVLERLDAEDGDRPALVGLDGSLTINDLRRRRDECAAVLVAHGVRSGDRVAILGRRGSDLVAWFFGTLLVGAVAAVIDADRPRDFVAGALAATDPRVLVANAGWNPPGDHAVIDVRTRPPRLVGPVLPSTEPADAAYVLFTSGSTGEPKGVVVGHGALAAYLDWATPRYLGSRAVVAPWHTAVGADLGLTSWLLPLVGGGTVRVLPDAVGGSALVAHLRSATGPQVVKLTPTHLLIAAELLGDEPIDAQGWVFVVGGEALDAETVVAARAALPGAVIFNEYGPTEATVGCCVADVTLASPGVRVPIGRAVPGTRLHVVDAQLREVPDGFPGELLIAGDQVADGYIGRPRDVAAAFRPDAHAARPGQRTYRTGDRVVRAPDGVLGYLGRSDRQVNLAGNRIELGEVESLARRHPEVAEAAAVALGPPEQPNGIAVVVRAADREGLADDVQRHLHRAMARFVRLRVVVVADPLPLTAEGKVDRHAVARRAASEGPLLPATATSVLDRPVGVVVRQVVSTVVGVEPTDGSGFFQIGGDSLAAARVCARLRRQLDTRIEVGWVFEAPTVGALAERIEALTGPEWGLS